jgi:hypothetical protein
MGLTITGSAAGVEAESVGAAARYTNMRVAFDGGISLDVDLAELGLTQDQRLAVDKLIERASRIEDAQCVGDRCPAQDFLDPDDYKKVRGLKASLGAADDLAIANWIIIDFCIHPVVHRD